MYTHMELKRWHHQIHNVTLQLKTYLFQKYMHLILIKLYMCKQKHRNEPDDNVIILFAWYKLILSEYYKIAICYIYLFNLVSPNQKVI